MSLSLVLASQSPRRKELLNQLSYDFTCAPANINEDILQSELPKDYVQRLATEKALAITATYQKMELVSTVVLGSDTSVVYKNDILGKPSNLKDCVKYLQLLSGETHQVLTAISAVCNGVCLSKVVTTNVTFKVLTIEEIERYWNTGEPKDKAGAYGIQGIGGQFVTQLSGSYSAVVGLPLYETSQLLAEFGLFTSIQQPTKDMS